MVDQDLINKSSDLLERIVIGQVQEESVCDELVRLLNEMNSNYCQIIEDNAEMHKEIARLNHLNAHLNHQLEAVCNEEDEGVDE